jgi:hypothetical protein
VTAELLAQALAALEDYDDHLARRVALSEREDDVHHTVSSSEWADSDDEAVDLLGRCTEALRDLLADPPAEPARHAHRIEEAPKVYLELDEHGAWQIDHVALDGAPLDSAYDAVLHENDGCDFWGDPAILVGGTIPDLPTGEQLLHLLARALGKRVIG